MVTKRNEVIWVVDDEIVRAELYILELESCGYRVEAYASAATALRKLRDQPPALILTDYSMPGMNGIEFLQHVRKLYPTLPVIMFSGVADVKMAAKAGGLGIDTFLDRGSTLPIEFIAAVEGALTRAKPDWDPGKKPVADNRPKLFIGSSSEGLPIAEAIQQLLDQDAQAVLWNQGVFALGKANLETLVSKVHEYDFAVMVLSADDLVTSRHQRRNAPRDNILLELGLFLGALGRERAFAVYDRTKNLKLPSDLAGISLADFAPHEDGSYHAALGPACVSIKSMIRRLGRRREA